LNPEILEVKQKTMKRLSIRKKLGYFAGTGALCLLLLTCGRNGNPVAANEETATHTIRLQIQPPTSLRTEETWNLWTTPVDITFDVTQTGAGKLPAGASDGSTGFTLQKVVHEDSTGIDSSYIGSFHGNGMDISLMLGAGMPMWERHQNGMMEEHHAAAGAHHYGVQILDGADGGAGHPRMVVPMSQVTLSAIAGSDTTVVPLRHVQGYHGYRYESNAALPYRTYTLLLDITPPGFYRTEATRHRWTSSMEVAFAPFSFDSTAAAGVVGDTTVSNTAGDSLQVQLVAGSPKTYGAVGTGLLPPAESENINFSLRLGDPAVTAEGEPICDALVTLSITDDATGDTEQQTLRPTYGRQGFYYGANMMMEMYQGTHTHRGGMFGSSDSTGSGAWPGHGSMMDAF